MYIELASAKLDRKMEKTWGRPTPMDQQYEEWFGWYHIEDDSRYWSYTPQTQTWRVISATYDRHPVGAEFSDEDRKQIGKDMKILADCPPDDPEDPGVRAEMPPFLHNGWLYAWYYFPELKRWEIGLLGKR